MAALTGRANIAKALLKAGADANVDNDLALWRAQKSLESSQTERQRKRYAETVAGLEDAMQR